MTVDTRYKLGRLDLRDRDAAKMTLVNSPAAASTWVPSCTLAAIRPTSCETDVPIATCSGATPIKVAHALRAAATSVSKAFDRSDPVRQRSTACATASAANKGGIPILAVFKYPGETSKDCLKAVRMRFARPFRLLRLTCTAFLSHFTPSFADHAKESLAPSAATQQLSQFVAPSIRAWAKALAIYIYVLCTQS
jgi:hypothetical protein